MARGFTTDMISDELLPKASGLRGWFAANVLLFVWLFGGAAALAAGDGSHGGDLHINWWTWDDHAPPVGWFALDFLLFMGILVRMLRRPLAAMFSKRHLEVKQAIEDADEALVQTRQSLEASRAQLADVDTEANELIVRGRQDGELERGRIIANAEAASGRLGQESETIMHGEILRARGRLQRTTVSEAVAKAENILNRAMTKEDHGRLVDRAIDQLEQLTDFENAIVDFDSRTELKAAGGVA